MKTRELGRSGLKVSAIGLGCMGMSHAYGAPADKREMTELLSEAVSLGYTFFDTAEIYGTPENPYENELLVGEALKPFRDSIALCTKFGIRFDKSSGKAPYPIIPDARPERIRESVEGSLKRLQTDHIDLYYQHRPDPNVPAEDVAGTVADLIREGKVLHWGLSEAPEEYIRRAHAVCPVAAVENRYSMMARWHEALFPVLEDLGIGFAAFSPLANGLLTQAYRAGMNFSEPGDYRAAMPQFKKESFEKNKELFALLNDLAAKYRATSAQVSLAWMLAKKPWIVPIPGTRKSERLRENAGAAGIELSREEAAAIDAKLDEIEMSEVFGGSRIVKRGN